MIIAEEKPTSRWKVPAKRSAVVAFVLLVASSLLLAANAASSQPSLVLWAQSTAAGALLFGLVSLGTGVMHLLKVRPDMKRPLIFVTLLCLIVLGAHLYIINSPPAYTAGSPLSGSTASTFSDSQLQVSSIISGSSLTVTVTNIGSNAVSSVSLDLGNSSLPASGFTEAVTPTDPLQPQSVSDIGFRDSATGTWAMPSGAGSTLKVHYEYLTCYHVPDSNDRRGVFGCVMDETYYVPSAMALLSGTQCANYVPNCNLEHPFLAKAMIAAGIAVFGLSDFGWRIFNAILGTLSIALLFVLTYMISGNRRLAYFASILLALDVLFFVHSSAALIDVPPVFFSLLGFIFYFWRTSYWKVDHLIASGVFFGLAVLSKETAVFMVGAVITYELLTKGRNLRPSLVDSLKIVVPALLVFILGVQVYDSLFTSGTYPYFYQQVSYMLSYGAGLKGGGWTDSYLHSFITPLNWVTFYSPVSYLVTSVKVTAGSVSYSYVGVGYYGIANVIIVWMIFVWLPLAVYRAYSNRKQGTTSPDDRLGGFMAVWFSWAYVPYVLLWLYGRVTYPFYILPAIPAMAAGAAYFITRSWFSYKLALVYVAFGFFLFFLYFPDKSFLPVAIRAALGR